MKDQLESRIGYRFSNDQILTEALTHASVADSRLQSNERMEFLGDAVLGFVVCEFLYNEYPELLEGDLTKIKSSVVSRRTCAIVSEKLDLAGLLNMGKGMTGRSELPSSIGAAAYESIIAAIFLDGGLEPARQFILEHLESIIRMTAETSHQHNFKSALQQMTQREISVAPSYKILDEKGPDHAKCFEVCVEIEGRRFSSAWANTKKEAEQKAALIALCELGVASVDEEGHVHVEQDGSFIT